MIKLFYKKGFIKRNHEYLSGLEYDIRPAMYLQDTIVSFTREGDLYSQSHSISSKITGLSYVLILEALLVYLTAMRLITNCDSNKLYNLL